ncbi:MAG TPA: hypothetical protein VF070_18980 [Streptosporangiaceae bacterium]
MSYGGYAFAALAVDLGFILRLLTLIMLAVLVCWLAGYAFLMIGVKVVTAWGRRREQSAYRAEVARGLAELDRFVQAHAARTAGSGRADPDANHDEP